MDDANVTGFEAQNASENDVNATNFETQNASEESNAEGTGANNSSGEGYVMRKSPWEAVDAPKLLVITIPFVLGIALAIILRSFIPLLALLVTLGGVLWLWIHIFILKHEYITFTKTEAYFHKGVFNTKQHSDVFIGVKNILVDRTLFGNLLGYGTVTVNMIGMADVRMTFVADPEGAETFFKGLKVKPKGNIKRISFGN